MTQLSHKEKSEQQLDKFVSILSQAEKSLERIKADNNDVEKYISTFKNIITNALEDVKKRVEDVRNRMVWDRLIIGFFGSTNAGKSTIIETLRILYEKDKRDADGTIVGDGRPDFTEVFDEYNLVINKIPVTLIDMPGIFSNEKKYKEQIREALDKCHIVMYVNREDTKPDTKTVKKIQSYLSDWVKVYSVYNISGFDYDQNLPLLSDKKKESETLIINGFREALQSTYVQNISLQGLLALTSVANFTSEHKDLIKYQKRFNKQFSSKEQMLQYSNMNELVKLLEEKGRNLSNEIYEANTQRIYSICSKVRLEIQQAKEKQTKLRSSLPIELQKYCNDISRYFDTTQRVIKSGSHSIINTNIEKLREVCQGLVDNDVKNLKDRCEFNEKHYCKEIQREVSKHVNNEINRLQQDISRRGNKLRRNIVFEINTKSYVAGEYIDFDGAEQGMHMNIDKGLDLLENIAGGAGVGVVIGTSVPVIGSAIGTVIGAAAGLGKGLWDLLDGTKYRKKVKASINDAISEACENIKEDIDNSLQDIIINLLNEKESIKSKVEEEIEKLKDTDKSINAIYKELDKYENELIIKNI
ncbi:MAG: 50S ribosome-binding GTPase [Bacteroidaceae bacterium]|nr:50S ribosome-binding GTPase [Bacteroidaceae bacterium]